ncbi:MAG: T9SS type A sorting domain-containing protein [Bacteroidales bacterium]|nr:T9SS type A sorting domain-containing protein [Bacteroidales bacterium]
MKRILVSWAIVFMACHASAQTLDSIAHHVLGYYGPNGGGQMENAFQMSDGSILFVHKEGINFGGGGEGDVVGHEYYKVSRHGAVILDTLFVYDDDPPYYFFTKTPNGNDNLRIGIFRDSINHSSFIRVFPFDSDLRFDTLNEVRTLLSDTLAFSFKRGYLINSSNDLVFSYLTPIGGGDYDLHFACFGLDGTLKHENVMPFSSFPLRSFRGMCVFNESPLEYCLYGINHPANSHDQFVGYVFDSLFQFKNSFNITQNSALPNFYYEFGMGERLLVDGDDFILCSRYEKGTQNNGVCLVRYDKHTLEEKDVALFQSMPMIPSGTLGYGAYPTGLGKDAEGSLYFAYSTQNLMFTDKGQVAVVKLDADFNVQWQRFCLEPEGYYRNASVFAVLNDGGVAVAGGYWYRPEIFMLVVSDDGWGVNETAMEQMHPYAYWPNPAQDELHLQYSPDVTPTQIELHDLQGRMVRSQRNGLESLNLQGLSSGTYTMRVTLAGGKVFTDKVVKN